MQKWMFPWVLLFLGHVAVRAQQAVATGFKTAKADEAVQLGDYCAFRVNKNWGVYRQSTKKNILEPRFDYVLLTPYGFLAAREGKISYYACDGSVLKASVDGRLGFFWNQVTEKNQEFIMDVNGEMIAATLKRDSLSGNHLAEIGPYPWTGSYLHNLHIRELEYFEGHVAVNAYDFNNLGAQRFEEASRSGLYNPATAKWDIKPEHISLVPYTNHYITLVSAGEAAFPQAFHYIVYDSLFKPLRITADLQTHLVAAEDLKKLIPYPGISSVTLLNSQFVQGGLYAFESGGKTGLFQLDYLRVVEPPENDAVIDARSTVFMFPVKDGKTGFLDPYSSGTALEKKYTHIYAGNMRDRENTGKGIKLDDTWYTIQRKNEMEKVYDSVWEDHRYPYTAVYTDGKYVYTRDVTPVFHPEFPVQVMHGAETVDSLDSKGNPVYPYSIPAVFSSGVLDVKKQQWIVPRQYEETGPAGFHFYGAITNGNIKLFTLYDVQGNRVADNLSSFMEITAPALWESIVQYPRATRTGRVECDTGSRAHRLHNAVYIKYEEQTGVFNLDGMQWIIRPLEGKLEYFADGNVFVQRLKKGSDVLYGLYSENGQTLQKPAPMAPAFAREKDERTRLSKWIAAVKKAN